MWPLIVAFAWGLYPFFFKFIHPTTNPVVIWTINSSITALMGLVICFITKKSLILQNKNDYQFIIIAAIIGSLGTLLYFALLIKTEKKSIVIALSFTAPLFACLLGHYFFGEILTLKQFIGIAVIVAGIMLVIP